MNIGVWVGLIGGVAIVVWNIFGETAGRAFLNSHGVFVVVGGTIAAVMVSTPLRIIGKGLLSMLRMFVPGRQVSPEEVIDEMVRLARRAQEGGGLLALREEGRDFLEGFPHRAIMVAISAGEVSQTRQILEKEVKQKRIGRQEEVNFWRTVSVLSPMFGIMGTLLGMIQVLGTLQDPTKVGPYMALALSSAFLGIGIANLFCVPVAGFIRLAGQRETLIYEIALEGILDISSGKAPFLVEMHLSSYSEARSVSVLGEGGPRPPAPAA
jgi:chemotaxis protein MotA